MALTDTQFKNLTENKVSLELLANNGLNDSYYISPLMYIQDTLGLQLTCSGLDYKHACEMAHDEDIVPHDGSLAVIGDGILAFVYADQLEECGMDLTTYFSYRFHPPSREFQEGLNKFESLIREAN